MYSIFLPIVVFFITLNVFAEAEKNIVVDGEMIFLTDVVETSGHMIDGSLKETSDIKFGENTLLSVPKGTSVKLLLDPSGGYYISLMVFSKQLPVQSWRANGVNFSLDCSTHGVEENYRARVVTFYKNKQMNGRCKSLEEKEVETSGGDIVTVGKGSLVFFDEDGRVRSSTIVKNGVVSVFNQKVEILENSFLDYNNQGGVHFLYLKEGSFFKAPTSLGEETVFVQQVGVAPSPTLFYNHGAVESGFVELGSVQYKKVKVLDSFYDFEVHSGHVGFTEDGILDRFVMGESVSVSPREDSQMYLVDQENQESVSIPLKAGESFPIATGSNLFLMVDENGEAILKGFPVMVSGDWYFLSLVAVSAPAER